MDEDVMQCVEKKEQSRRRSEMRKGGVCSPQVRLHATVCVNARRVARHVLHSFACPPPSCSGGACKPLREELREEAALRGATQSLRWRRLARASEARAGTGRRSSQLRVSYCAPLLKAPHRGASEGRRSMSLAIHLPPLPWGGGVECSVGLLTRGEHGRLQYRWRKRKRKNVQPGAQLRADILYTGTTTKAARSHHACTNSNNKRNTDAKGTSTTNGT